MNPKNEGLIFRKGVIYNKHYCGENEAYGKQNGHQTFRVLEVDTPKYKLVTKDLFATHPDPFSKRLEENGSTSFTNIEYLLSKFEIKEVHSRKDYIVHSVIMKPQEAIDKGLVSVKTIEDYFAHRCPIVGHSGVKKFIGCSLQVSIDGTDGAMGNKYLQTVVFVWKDWKIAEKEIRAIYPGACFD